MRDVLGHVLFAATALAAAAGVSAPATEAEISAARASRPPADDTFVVNDIARRTMGVWVSRGQVPGNVLFEETFADEASVRRRWTFGKGTAFADDGRGGHCVTVTPDRKGYVNFTLKSEALIPVDGTHPVAVLWETRAPKGGSPVFARFDFYDKDRKPLRAHQIRSAIDPTELNIFHRNAHCVTMEMPRQAAFLRLMFHHSPSNDQVGEIAHVRVVDLVSSVDKALSGRAAVRAERAAARGRVLAYVADNLTSNYPVMSAGECVPGRAGDVLRLRECAGEMTRATIVLWCRDAKTGVGIRFGDLKCGPRGTGGTLPASALSAKVVKAHYQAEGAPYVNIVLGTDQVLVPELLLNDDTLVVPDHVHRHNYVKYQLDGKAWYEDINAVAPSQWGRRIPPEEMPITDAPTLRPFDLEAGLNKQLVLQVRVPKGAKPGVYKGAVEVTQGKAVVAKVPLSVEVLPFALPERAETAYDPERHYTMGLYTWSAMSADGSGSMTPFVRSRAQVLATYRTMVENGVTSPALIWPGQVVFDDRRFREHLDVAREAGFKETLYLGWSGYIGNSTDPKELKAMQDRLVHAMAIAREYGFGQVYFYGFDEAKGDRLLSQLTAWHAARQVGAKTIVSGYRDQFERVGKELDLCVWNEEPESARPEQWHALGHRLWKYGTPQAGPENPDLYRRNYGLFLWNMGFDGGNTYCETTGGVAWNDLAAAQLRLKAGKPVGHCYRSETMLYPTTDGVIETLSFTGLASAIKDIRYMTKLRQQLRAKPNAAAQKWLDSLDYSTADLASVRRRLIDWILKTR